jgi:hypothetical protein
MMGAVAQRSLEQENENRVTRLLFATTNSAMAASVLAHGTVVLDRRGEMR